MTKPKFEKYCPHCGTFRSVEFVRAWTHRKVYNVTYKCRHCNKMFTERNAIDAHDE